MLSKSDPVLNSYFFYYCNDNLYIYTVKSDNMLDENEFKKEKNRERAKAHYEANKERRLAQMKIYYEANKERRLDQMKIYYEANKDKIKANSKAHYAKKKREKQRADQEA